MLCVKENHLNRDLKETEAVVLKKPTKVQYLWSKVLAFSYLHACAFYGFWLLETSAKWQTHIFIGIVGLLAGFGTTAGAHRLWSHRAYRARRPLRIILIFFHTLTIHFSIIDWVKDHRVHHKFTDTDADPYNATNGFFFSHLGWYVSKRHPEVHKALSKIDVSDLEKDKLLMFQHQYFIIIALTMAILIVCFPVFWWKETFKISLFVNIYRHLLVVHITSAVSDI
jgi:stearoyl-CoA desaturase (Delta-9 desaturase)